MATLVDVYATLYGYADNDPPGSDTTSLGGHAGGTGSFNDPITAAANSSGLSGQFSYGTKFYVPELGKYFIIRDYMADASGGASHVDLWVGGDASTPASQQNAAEWALTDNYQIILNPPSNEPVNTTPLITAAHNLDAVLNHNAAAVTDGDDTILIAGADACSHTIDGGDGVDTLKVVGDSSVTLAHFSALASSIEIWDGNGAGLVGTRATTPST